MVFPGSCTGTAWADRDWELFYACCKNAREGELLLSQSCSTYRDLVQKEQRALKVAGGIRQANDRFPGERPAQNDSDLNNRLRN